MKKWLCFLLAVLLVSTASAEATITINWQDNNSAGQGVYAAETAMTERLIEFFSLWRNNVLDSMLELCDPAWRGSMEKPREELFWQQGNRIPLEINLPFESIDGADDADVRTMTLTVLYEKNNGKAPVRSRQRITMVRNRYDGLWYVDPRTLRDEEMEKTPRNDRPDPDEETIVLDIGSRIAFGNYEQDNNPENGPEPIEWLVLDVQGSKRLLISKYGLNAIPYNDMREETTWEQCTLRTWLNSEFLQAAFSREEQAAILITDVDNSASQWYSSEWSITGGNNTKDQVFLLSYAEANLYFHVTMENRYNTESRVAPTAYAIENGASQISKTKTAAGEGTGCWWLRSPGHMQDLALIVDYYGALSRSFVHNAPVCVRPALWVDLNAELFR